MPTITETEHRLRDTLHAVASSVQHSEEPASDHLSTTTPWAPPIIIRDRGARRRNPVLVFAASFAVVVLVGAISLFTGGTVPGGDPEVSVGVDAAPATTVAPSEETSPETTAPAGVSTARIEFWGETLAHWLDVVRRQDTFGPNQPEPDARVVGPSATGDAFGEGGSMTATVESEEGQITVRGEYLGRGEPVDQATLQTEIADLTADGAEHVDTIWFSPDENPEWSGENPEWSEETVQADFFLTESGSGSRMTVLTALGWLVIEVDTTDPTRLLNTNQLMGIATGMIGTSLDLTWDPNHPLSMVVESVPEPEAGQWVALDSDVWVASVDEGESRRLWFKTDIQEPTASPSTDTRSAYLYAGDDFVVVVVGEPIPGVSEPIPDVITVTWEDGSTQTVEPTWNADLDMGLARFDDKGTRVLDVEGP